MIRVTVRSVNHRFLDVRVKAPDGFEGVEARIREVIRARVHRGHLDVALHYQPSGPATVQVNGEIAAAYLAAAENLRRQFNLSSEPDLAAILRLPGVVGAPEALGEGDEERFAKLVETCLVEALEKLDEMRKSEGRILAQELFARLKTIRDFAGQIEILAERIRPAYAKRLEARLKDLLNAAPVDPARHDWVQRGNIAYSKICTHAGCPVAIYRKFSHQLYCPCHQSVFNVLGSGKPISGPATRALPQLALDIDAHGYLIARGDYAEPVGPDDWWRPV